MVRWRICVEIVALCCGGFYLFILIGAVVVVVVVRNLYSFSSVTVSWSLSVPVEVELRFRKQNKIQNGKISHTFALSSMSILVSSSNMNGKYIVVSGNNVGVAFNDDYESKGHDISAYHWVGDYYGEVFWRVMSFLRQYISLNPTSTRHGKQRIASRNRREIQRKALRLRYEMIKSWWLAENLCEFECRRFRTD